MTARSRWSSWTGPRASSRACPRSPTSPSKSLAIVRFHGRRTATWEATGIQTVERFRYLYDDKELGEWVPKIAQIADQAEEVHVLFNNCYANYGSTNALQMANLLDDLRNA